jgi:hypothetical protein
LDNVIPARPLELSHFFFHAKIAKFPHVELRIPIMERFVQAIEPVREIK